MKTDPFRGNKIYIELTNPVHGGVGWEFGTVLWSPSKDKSGADRWKILKRIKPGDIVFHSVKGAGNAGHKLMGISRVRSSYIEVDDEPPTPGIWAGHSSYLRIPLQDYGPFASPIKLQDFLSQHKSELLKTNTEASFYTKNTIRLAQKYVSELPEEVAGLLREFVEHHIGSKLFENIEYFNDANETEPPRRAEVIMNRIVRDTKMAKELKTQYDNRCQICGKIIHLPHGKSYSEGHHLQKLGEPHRGPDIKENIIILCSNHHVEFDYGAIAIENDRIIHVNSSDEYHGKSLSYTRKDLGHKYLAYHKRHIFNK
jgi:hypothetical protein